ncbi:hypothetical protein D9M70_492510 [compost metagenome]
MAKLRRTVPVIASENWLGWVMAGGVLVANPCRRTQDTKAISRLAHQGSRAAMEMRSSKGEVLRRRAIPWALVKSICGTRPFAKLTRYAALRK